jgi:hypothetical protein
MTLGKLDERHDILTFKIPLGLPSLPLVELACEVNLQRVFESIPSCQVDLAFRGLKQWLLEAQQVEEEHEMVVFVEVR